MTELIAFDIERSEELTLNGRSCVVHFHKRRDGEEYRLIAIDHESGKQESCSYSEETAAYFKALHGAELADEVARMLAAHVTTPV